MKSKNAVEEILDNMHTTQERTITAGQWLDALPVLKLSPRTVKELAELLKQKNYILTKWDFELIEMSIRMGLSRIDDEFHKKVEAVRDRRTFFEFIDSFNNLHPNDKCVFLMCLKKTFCINGGYEDIARQFSETLAGFKHFDEDPKRGHPKEAAAAARIEMIDSFYDEFLETYKIKPTDAENGIFASFIRTIFADPALKKRGLAITDIRRLIRHVRDLKKG